MTKATKTLSIGALGAALALMSASSFGKDRLVSENQVRHEPLIKAANMSYKVRGMRYTPVKQIKTFSQTGQASWYGPGFHGKKTASGERFDMHAYTAAHKTLPIPSYAKVTNLSNGKSVIVRINDRGPFHGSRVIDLSKGAAQKIGFSGVANVRVEQIVPGQIAAAQPEQIYVTLAAFDSESAARDYAGRTNSRLQGAASAHRALTERKDGRYVVKLGPFAKPEQADSARQMAVAQNSI
ncbi:septal ring lytic transglycosylase RlpA family protein [Neisseria canis]|uniref:Endolytic peptidoglycan transglycosylase RlpA n=1 Tax=Neisseria canis TaxID=493 RepID=A0A448D6R7_9NEIS|nr:septal ring lytic transglycosylase RlpA family protein [Neisseria canis]VEF00189.1 RlpA-like protein [Neisseria canis]